ncbi:hypothetical protein [Streptomyces sp. NPDC048584]|uniref:hypothetical protein n=1 Tax=Streptomyces sp. NPDC048584 TaxID=3365573 RepID=UPI00371CCC7E
MTDWSRLHHAYGTAEDVPGLLDGASTDSQSPAWDELWSRLCHQGTVYSASYAVLPALTQLARQWSTPDRQAPLYLAGSIVISTDRPHDWEDPRVTYTSEISELIRLTEEALQDPTLADVPGTYVDLLATLLSFQGVEVWGEQLEGLHEGEYEVSCPACASENFVVFGEYGFFSTTDSMYMNETAAKKIPLQPTDASALEGIARELHSRALADNQTDVAGKLTYVFGEARCAECDAVFSVADAVTSRWGR